MSAESNPAESLSGFAEPGVGLAFSIEAGLPVGAIDQLAGLVAPADAHFKYRVIPKATLDRRRRSADGRLTPEEGDRVARLAKVFAFALRIYKEPERVRAFLNGPHMMLRMRSPLDVALASGAGADLVINILGAGAYGGGV